jgi:hypothetical protein
MRSNEMEVGETYVLSGRTNRKVTVLETPAEVRSAARVRVRFENGVKAGEIAEIPSRRIARPWREEAPSGRARRQPIQPPPAVAERPAQLGDTVTLSGDESGLRWTVAAIEGGRARLQSEIFSRPVTREVGMGRLQVYEEPGRGQLVYLIGERKAGTSVKDAALDEKQWVAEHLSPERPKRELDRILDQLVFSQGCLRIYQRRLAPHLKGKEGVVADRLRQEIRHKGYLVRGEELRGSEYARLRVRKRFDIVLNSPPPPDEAVIVDWIHFPTKQTAKRERGRRRRAA